MQKIKIAESLMVVTYIYAQVYLDDNKKINDVNIKRLSL